MGGAFRRELIRDLRFLRFERGGIVTHVSVLRCLYQLHFSGGEATDRLTLGIGLGSCYLDAGHCRLLSIRHLLRHGNNCGVFIYHTLARFVFCEITLME